MHILLVILAALAPVVVSLWYIYNKDSMRPEPTFWLAKAFGYGVFSAFLSFGISVPLSSLLNIAINTETYTSFFQAFADAFISAAIPEEIAKFIMLWLLLRKNPFFDEKFDGIVYAVCISMGFAGFENILYLWDGIEDGSWLSIGINRAIFSIPGHFFFAVLMGYYYSLYYFGIDRSLMTLSLVLGAPILAHGIFDGILFCLDINEVFAVIGLFAFLYFFSKLKQRATVRIEELRNQ